MEKFKAGDKVWCAGGYSGVNRVWSAIVLKHDPNCQNGFLTLQTTKPLKIETFFWPDDLAFLERTDAVEKEVKRIKMLIKFDKKEIKRVNAELVEIEIHKFKLTEALNKLLEPPED